MKGREKRGARTLEKSRSEVISRKGAAIKVVRYNLSADEAAELSVNTRFSDIRTTDHKIKEPA